MAGDSAAASSHSSKRKRGHSDEGRSTDNKQRRTSAYIGQLVAKDSKVKEGFRTEITAIYSSYSRLLQGVSTNASEDGTAFQALLDASQGTCAARRLAARLAPGFLHRFPQQVEATATMLMALYQEKQRSDYDVDTVIDSMKSDALRGLGSVLDAAMKLVDKAVPTVLHVVDFLLRQLHAQSVSAKGLAHSSSMSSLDFCDDAIDNFLAVQQLLEKAYRCFPRVVLACCLKSFRDSGTTLYRAALIFLEKHLLCEPVPSAAPHSSDASGSHTGGGVADVAMGGAKQSPAQELPDSMQSQCLAAEVLRRLPDSQAWLRQVILVLSKDKRLASAKELHPHIAKLLKLVTSPKQQLLQCAEAASPTASQQTAADEQLSRKSSLPQHEQHAQANEGAAATVAANGHLEGGLAGQSPRHRQKQQQQAASNMPGPPPLPSPPAASPSHAAAAAAGAPGAAAAARKLDPLVFTGRGGSICRAGPCLFLGYLPVAVTEASLMAELVRRDPSGRKDQAPDSIHMAGSGVAGLGPGEAYVVFKATIPDAAVCYEALAETLPFGGSRPLHIEFCPALPPDCPARTRAGKELQAPPYVWVAGHPLESVLNVLRQAGLPHPEQVVEVSGGAPGFMLDYRKNASLVQPVVDCLVAKLLPPGHPQHQLIAAAAAAAAAASSGLLPLPPAAASAAGQLKADEFKHAPKPGTPAPPSASGNAAAAAAAGAQAPQAAPGSVPGAWPGPPAAGGTPLATPAGPTASRWSEAWTPPPTAATHHPPGFPRPPAQTPQQVPPGFSGHHLLPPPPQGGPPPGFHSHHALPHPPPQQQLPSGFPGHHVTPGPHPQGPRPGFAAHPVHQQTPLSGFPGHHPPPGLSPNPHMPPAQQQQQLPAGFQPAPHPHLRPSPVGPSSLQHTSSGPLPGHHPHSQHTPLQHAASMPAPGHPPHMQHAGQLPHMHQHPMQHIPPHLQSPYPMQQHPPRPPSGFGAPSLPSQPAMQPPPHLPGAKLGTTPLSRQHSPAHELGNGSSHATMHAQADQQQLHGAVPGAAAGALSWQGLLAKSGAAVCPLSCCGNAAAKVHRSDIAAAAAGGGLLQEPSSWPETLDVKFRVELRYVEQLYCGTQPASRALRWLVPLAGGVGDVKKLSEFVQYLADKSRAGVVKLGSNRTLYLLPPSAQVCATLGAEWPVPSQLEQYGNALVLVVVVPTPANSAR